MATEQAVRTLLSELPEDALANVVLSFSNHPLRSQRMKELSVEDLFHLAQADHPLHRSAQAVVTELHLPFKVDASSEIVNIILDAFGEGLPNICRAFTSKQKHRETFSP